MNCFHSGLLPFFLCLIAGLIRQDLVNGSGLAPVALARYSFTTNACNAASFPDTAGNFGVPFPPFQRNPAFTQCSKGLGVEVAPAPGVQIDASTLQLEKDAVDEIFQRVKQNEDGISFEFWLKPYGEEFRGTESTIFTVGSNKTDGNEQGASKCDNKSFDLQVSVNQNNQLQVFFRRKQLVYYDFDDCWDMNVAEFDVQPGKLIHLVISLRDEHQVVYVNGHSELTDDQGFSVETFDDSEIMTFFSGTVTSQDNIFWQGSVYQFSIYDTALSQDEVEKSLTAGLDGDHPYSFPYQVTLNEDAEAEPGSHPKDWYIQPQSLLSLNRDEVGDLQGTPLLVRPVQDEIKSLLASANLPYNESALSTSTTSLAYITSLPSRGSLLHFTDEGFVELRHKSHMILIDDPTSLIFLPPYNEHSDIPGGEYTSFTYCATNRVIFDPVQCDSSRISIVVDAVNDPPVAFASPARLQTVEGVNPEEMPSIQLGGTEMDRQDSIASIQITTPPKWGTLMLRVTTFREDGLTHGTILSPENQFTVASDSSLNSVYVIYLFNTSDPSLSRPPVPGNNATDYFLFRVSDRNGLWSLEQAVHVEILSAVEAAPVEPTLMLPGDEATKVSFRANDASGYERHLATFFETVPDEDYGWLVDTLTENTVRPGSMVKSGDVSFLPNSKLCDSMGSDSKLSVTYRAVALESEKVTSISDLVNQTIEIQCPLLPIEVSASSKPLHLQAFSLSSFNKTACGDSLYASLHAPLPASCTEASIVDLSQVSKPRRNSGRVLVTVLPKKGFITFAEDSWYKVRPIRGRGTMASENVTFAASVGDLQEIFDGLTFRGLFPGHSSLEIRFQYEDCTSGFDFNRTPSVTGRDSACSKTSLKIPVEVEEGEADDEFQNTSFPWIILNYWFGYPIGYFFYYQVNGWVMSGVNFVRESVVWLICAIGRTLCYCLMCKRFGRDDPSEQNDDTPSEEAEPAPVIPLVAQDIPALPEPILPEGAMGFLHDVDGVVWYTYLDETSGCTCYINSETQEYVWDEMDDDYNYDDTDEDTLVHVGV